MSVEIVDTAFFPDTFDSSAVSSENMVRASTPIVNARVSQASQVKMANVRRLPKLKRLLDENSENMMMCSPLKQIKLSPIRKCGSVSKDPRLAYLQGAGQLKVSIYVNYGLLTVNVIQAKSLSCKLQTTCNPYVQMSLVPGDSTRTSCKTSIIQHTNNPMFDERFSFELLEEERDKRLLISVWHLHDADKRLSEFLGCMSFGIKNLLNCNKVVGGWYCLLREDVGRRKHLAVTPENILQDKTNVANMSIPEVNKDLLSMEPITVVVKRGRHGYGFSLNGSCPAQICRVEEGSHAEHAGLRRSDFIVRINGQNVSRSAADSIARIVRQCQKQIILDIQRPREIETLEPCSRKPLGEVIGQQSSLQGLLSTEEQCKENAVDAGKRRRMRGTTTAKPQISITYQDLSAMEMSRQSAIQGLVCCEDEFVKVMRFGIQHYSRPLRHHILTSQEHAMLFQNLEKLVVLSEFHASQMRENSLAYSDLDGSEERFIDTVGSVYQPKILLLCGAYEAYCSGLHKAEKVLSKLRAVKQFETFLQEGNLDDIQTDLSAFINKPAQHLHNLLIHLQATLTNTRPEHHDHKDLLEVINVVQHSCNKINEVMLHSSASTIYNNTSIPAFNSSQQTNLSRSVTVCEQTQTSISSLASSSSSTDSEVIDLQQRLLFARNVQSFQLAAPSRHVIYSGELLQVEGRKWAKVWAILFNDLLLLTKIESDGYLTVLEEPIYLKNITTSEFDCEHPSEFTIATEIHMSDETKVSYDLRKVTLRAPTIEQKFVWKSIIEHRLLAGKVGRDSLLLPARLGDFVENFGVV